MRPVHLAALALFAFTTALTLVPLTAGATVQGTIPVDPDKRSYGSFARAGTQTWRLRLEHGKDYEINGFGDAYERVVVRAPGGKPVASFVYSHGVEDEGNGA